ncbi:MAG: hypothetical protein CVU05_00205 [Bacteroidetes bacterium HGW-Bacteroidetes-21]|jgi:hypothetical protein|nr:MAG: hypothetical protein CVU05_00205 [Bacteroidetes bacterium HGW-Bacteroidetes-21]
MEAGQQYNPKTNKTNLIKFHEMEKEYNLFSLRSKDGFPIWDIIRYNAYFQLIEKQNVEKNKVTNSKKNIKFFLKVIASFIKLLFPFKENLFFLTSRNNDNNSKMFDQNADTAIHLFEKSKCIIIESFFPNKTYKYSNYKTIHISAILFLTKFFKVGEIELGAFNQIKHSLENTFCDKTISIDFLINVFTKFQKTYSLYNIIFKLNKGRIKRLFIVQNGIQKALFYAAKKNGIRIFEFQHGIIDSTHMNYSYNPNIGYNDSNVIVPNVLFTFSDFWESTFFNPTKCIPCGNDSIYKKIASKGEDALTVISTVVHDNELRKLSLEIANKMPNLQIYYKLHPNNYYQYNEILFFFQSHKNVKIITNEFSVQQLISKSKSILAIVSTSVYEALHNDVKAIILKKINYTAHKDIFNYPNVYLIDNVEEFHQAFNSQNVANSNVKDVFFMPFNKELFIQAIQ